MTHPNQMTSVMVRSLTKGLAFWGQFLIPSFFVVAAGVTLLRGLKDRSAALAPSIEPEWSREQGSGPAEADEFDEKDLCKEWKEAGAAPPTRIDESRWNMNLLKALEWKRFEILCATYFEAIGFRSQRTHAGADGGVDIHLFAQGASTTGVLVQCKAWPEWQVGVALVRELFGVMAAEKVAEGILVTTSKFTPDAIAFAIGKNIHLIDGEDFLGKLLALDQARRDCIRRLVTEGDYTTPTCPSCGDGSRMSLRTSGKDGSLFWGCGNFPRCRTTMRATRAS